MYIDLNISINKSDTLHCPDSNTDESVTVTIYDDTGSDEARQAIVEAFHPGYADDDADDYEFADDLFDICIDDIKVWIMANGNEPGHEAGYTEDGVDIDRIDELVELIAEILDKHPDDAVKAAIMESATIDGVDDMLRGGYTVIEDLEDWARSDYADLFHSDLGPLTRYITDEIWRKVGNDFLFDHSYTELSDGTIVRWCQ